MKKYLLITILTIIMVMENSFAKDIILDKPNINDPFINILNNRVSTRSFDKNKKIDIKTLGEILWSAYGINRLEDNKRTIPTALNRQDLAIYVIKKDGVWLYDAKKSSLKLVNKNDLTKYFNTQDYMNNIDINLLYVSTNDDNNDNYVIMATGSAYQNVALYCSNKNIGNIVRGYFDKDNLAKELNINKDKIIVSQAIGYMNSTSK